MLTNMDTPTEPITEQPAPIPLPESALQPQMGQTMAPPTVPAKKPFPISTSLIIAIIAAVGLIGGGIVGLSALKSQNLTSAPTPTPQASSPTPTPVRTLSSIAALPAFAQFEAANATLSAAIASFTPQDETLTPPTLVLPLGFQQ